MAVITLQNVDEFLFRAPERSAGAEGASIEDKMVALRRVFGEVIFHGT